MITLDEYIAQLSIFSIYYHVSNGKLTKKKSCNFILPFVCFQIFRALIARKTCCFFLQGMIPKPLCSTCEVDTKELKTNNTHVVR